jgi:hypothetical protein
MTVDGNGSMGQLRAIIALTVLKTLHGNPSDVAIAAEMANIIAEEQDETTRESAFGTLVEALCPDPGSFNRFMARCEFAIGNVMTEEELRKFCEES